eukprot:gene1180-1286_t
MRKSGAKTGAVTDAQGRQRFHGAFTGGFSAGYYNTVGSEEGFKPSTFRSSRSDRASVKRQRVEDFMDEDDGLLGGDLTAKEGMDSFASKKGKSSGEERAEIGHALSHIILEPSNSMGQKLLGLLGWKPGQGIGPRVTRRNHLTEAVDGKTTGTAIPRQALESGRVTFAPEDNILSKLPEPKKDFLGVGCVFTGSLLRPTRDHLGSSGNSQRGSRYHVQDLFKKPKGPLLSSGLNRGYEDDDDDDNVYDMEEKNQFSSFIVDDTEEFDMANKSKSTPLTADVLQKLCPSDHKPPIPGFHVAQRAQEAVAHYPPPVLPKDFSPRHVFHQPAAVSAGIASSNQSTSINISSKVSQRGQLLGEEVATKQSVFQLLKPEDQARIKALSQQLHGAQGSNDQVEQDRPMLAQSSRFQALAEAFKNRFTSASNKEEPMSSVKEGGIVKAEDLKTSLPSNAKDEAIKQEVKTAGEFRMVRQTSLWTPSSLLCKRCNVKVPDISAAAAAVTSANDAGNNTSVDPVLAKVFGNATDPLLRGADGNEGVPSSSGRGSKAGSSREDGGSLDDTALNEQRLEQDVYHNLNKPPIDLFRSIFDDGDDDDDEEEEESDEEGDEEHERVDDAKHVETNENKSPGDNGRSEKTSGQSSDMHVDPQASILKAESTKTEIFNEKKATEEIEAPSSRVAVFIPRSQRGDASRHAPSGTQVSVGRVAGKSGRALKPKIGEGGKSANGRQSSLSWSAGDGAEDSSDGNDGERGKTDIMIELPRSTEKKKESLSVGPSRADESDSEDSAEAARRRRRFSAGHGRVVKK